MTNITNNTLITTTDSLCLPSRYEGAPTRREDVSRFISILEGYSIEATTKHK